MSDKKNHISQNWESIISKNFDPKETRKAALGDVIDFTIFLLPTAAKKELPAVNDYQDFSNLHKHIIDRKTFRDTHKTHTADFEKVEAFAKKYTLKVLQIETVERWVSLEGTVNNINQALNIELSSFDIDGKPYYFSKEAVKVPLELENTVELISGINRKPVKISRIFSEELNVKSAQVKGKAVLPQAFEKLYNFPKDLDGTGQCLGILSLGGGYDDAVLDQYFAKIGIKKPDISWVGVDGATNDPGANPMFDYEVYMDLEIAASLAPGAKIVVYFAKNSIAGIMKLIKKAIHDHVNHPHVVSMSWGTLEDQFEPSEVLALKNVLQEAAKLNVTVLTSSGDKGSSGGQDGLNVQLPASNPFALAIGGSQVHTADERILHEDVWDQELSVAGKSMSMSTGGGFSSIWKLPAYQENAVPQEQQKEDKRGIPDVSANASSDPGILLQVGKTEQISIGTSAATPLWAALLTRINQHLINNNLSHAGFVNPYLYHNDLSPAFNQVIEGSNGAYEAKVGWDACTGLGTPNGENLLKQITTLKKKHNLKKGN